jgi:TRAP-type C4-dicarboxylate transport system permease small subunit
VVAASAATTIGFVTCRFETRRYDGLSYPNLVRRFADSLNYDCRLMALLAMTAVTVADVVLRIFRRPILGSYEIVEFLGAAVAAFAMAHTTLQRAHVAVELVVIAALARSSESHLHHHPLC